MGTILIRRSLTKKLTGNLILISIVLVSGRIFAETVSFQGQFSGWIIYSDALSDNTKIGLRYLPEMRIVKSLVDKRTIDTELALNCYSSADTNSLGDLADNFDLKLYRFWVRYSAPQFETRLGLQKINFGPAKILRSLMWFDKIDPQDPFKITEGVKGLLIRYYFLNNTNIWFWGLPGDNKLKGLEFVETEKDKVEFGARCQVPSYKGEVALSYNQRQIDKESWQKKMTSSLSDGTERRFALDGFWDIGIGLWFETSLGEIKINQSEKFWQEFVTIGGDYTFKPGIHILYEHFLQLTGSKIDQTGEVSKLSALSLDYSPGVIDSINTILYYDWLEGKTYFYLGWQRTYDNWQINLIGFSNRKDSSATFSGKGVQFTVTYNH